MSHDATNWAIKQRGLKPATKIVLWHLCDRYHPDYGCFPSKDTLADDCEMSVRSVYDHIKVLEDRGLLLVREVAKKSASGKWSSNSYILGCDPRFAQHGGNPSAKFADGKNASEPSANSRSNRRQILPTNPVKEPVKEKALRGLNSEFSREDETLAGHIASGKAFLCTQITSVKGRELVALGLVTADQCAVVGVRL